MSEEYVTINARLWSCLKPLFSALDIRLVLASNPYPLLLATGKEKERRRRMNPPSVRHK